MGQTPSATHARALLLATMSLPVVKRRKNALKRAQINQIRDQLRRWYTTSMVGRTLLQQEREHLEPVLNTLFGYHAVQVGCLPGEDLLNQCRIPHRVVMDPDPGKPAHAVLCAYPDALPIQSDSVDVVVLPHTLEFERAPHEILREVDRVLIPEGHVLILGFNPWSLWGLMALLRGRHKHPDPPWCGKFLSQTRLKDWLALLGFKVVLTREFFFRPPVQNEAMLRRLMFMERMGAKYWPRMGGGYLLLAQKRVFTLTPIRPRWRARRSMVGKLAEPTARTLP